MIQLKLRNKDSSEFNTDDLLKLESELSNSGYVSEDSKLIIDYDDDFIKVEITKVDDNLIKMLDDHNLVTFSTEQSNSELYIVYLQDNIYKSESVGKSNLFDKLKEITYKNGTILLVTDDEAKFNEIKKKDKDTIKKFNFIK